jgi:hypothetical protein
MPYRINVPKKIIEVLKPTKKTVRYWPLDNLKREQFLFFGKEQIGVTTSKLYQI